MIHILTSNPSKVISVYGYVDNLVIVHLYLQQIVPMNTGNYWYTFNVYHTEGMDLSDYTEYENDSQMRFKFTPVRNVQEALDQIIEALAQDEEKSRTEAERSNEQQEELIIASVVGYSWNKSVVRYIDSELSARGCESSCLDMYNYLRATNIDRIADHVKMMLQSEYVYPEDPVAFAYALMKVLNDGVVM